MAVSYKKLWKLLIDKDMKKEELSSNAFYSSITTVYFTGKSTWEQMIALNSAYSYISGIKTYVSTYSLD